MMHLQLATRCLAFQAQPPSLGSQQHSFRHIKLLGDSNTDYMIQFILQLYAGRVLDLPLFHGWIVHALCILPTTSIAHDLLSTQDARHASHQPIK